MKKLSLIFVLLASMFSLYGCYDDKEIDETAYIIALGIDKAGPSGYNYTFQFSAPLATMSSEGSSGGGSGSEGAENSTVRNIVITAPDFYTARNMTNNFLSKTIDMSHLKLIVFSNSVDSALFLNHSQFMLREREVRPHTAVALSKTSAEEYLKSVNPELEANTAKYYELMALRSNNVYSTTKTLSDFVDEIHSEEGVSSLPIACIGTGNQDNSLKDLDGSIVSLSDTRVKSKRAELRGVAIFKDGQVIGMLNGDFAMIHNILNRDIRSCNITIKNPYSNSSFLTFKLNVPSPATYSVDNTKKPCRIFVQQGFDIEFWGGGLPTGFSSYDELYKYARLAITNEITSYFQKLSRVYQTDIMKIGDCVKKRFLTQSDLNSFDWESTFSSAEFNVNIYFI